MTNQTLSQIKASNSQCTIWTDARLKELQQLWGEELPASRIALRLGIDKKTVLTKARKLGLPSRNKAKVKAASRIFALPQRQSHALSDFPTLGHCLYPHGNKPPFIFCGKPVTKRSNGDPSSMCSEHHALCYVGAPSVRQRDDRLRSAA